MSKLIILCGLPGSGKSYLAEELEYENSTYSDTDASNNEFNELAVIHSSDAIREELFGDPGSQENNALVFETMHKRVREDLKAGKTVIYDATNLTRKSRRAVINLATAETFIECHIVWAPIEVCIERDAARTRSVGCEVIDKMLRRWQTPDIREGFDEIIIHNSYELFDNIRYISSITQAMMIPHNNPHHTSDIMEHCVNAYKYLCEKEGFIIDDLKTAAYWHDIGKPYTKFYKKLKDNDELDYSAAHYYDHQNVGAYLVYGLFMIPGHRLYEGEMRRINWISWLINNHMEPYFKSEYYKTMNSDDKYWVDLLHEADLAAH